MKRIFTLIIMFCFCCIGFIGCQGIDKGGAMRTSATINSAEFVFLDNEAIALAESANDSGLRAEALEASNIVNEIRADAGLDELAWDINLETVANVRAKECSQKFGKSL